MSTVQQAEAPAKSVTWGIAAVKGRVKSIRESGGQRSGFLHVIVLPAADEWSSPATIEVYSDQRLGDVDSVVQTKVRIGGYARTWNREVEDPRTGEIRKRAVPTADNTLTAIL